MYIVSSILRYDQSESCPPYVEIASPRHSLASLGLPSYKPSKNVPSEILQLTYPQAKHITLKGLTTESAYEELIRNGASRSSVNERWVENHMQLIIWKLASLFRRYPESFSLDQWWTKEKVISQLCYRYQREVNEAHRPILKSICERDELSTRPMVLVVCDIRTDTATPSVLLSDGWYTLPGELDEALQRAVARGALFAGQKLYLYGAQV